MDHEAEVLLSLRIAARDVRTERGEHYLHEPNEPGRRHRHHHRDGLAVPLQHNHPGVPCVAGNASEAELLRLGNAKSCWFQNLLRVVEVVNA